MAILQCESFSIDTDDAALGKEPPGVASSSGSISAAAGPFGEDVYLSSSNGVNQNRLLVYTVSLSGVLKLGVSVWFKQSTVTDGEPYFLRVSDTAYQVGLRLAASGDPIRAYRGGTSTAVGTLLATGTTPLFNNVWHHVEAWFEIHDTTGRVKVWVDGNATADIDFTGDTNNASTNIQDVVLGIRTGNSGTTTGTKQYSSLVVYDDTGGVNATAPLGPARVIRSLANGNGNTSNGTGSDGNSTDNYLLVDDNPPDDDTTYVDFSTVGHKDTYAMANLGVTGTVLGVQVRAYARKTDAGARAMCTVLRTGSTEVDGSNKYLPISYTRAGLSTFHNTKPGGGSFTVSDVDGSEAGVKMTA